MRLQQQGIAIVPLAGLPCSSGMALTSLLIIFYTSASGLQFHTFIYAFILECNHPCIHSFMSSSMHSFFDESKKLARQAVKASA